MFLHSPLYILRVLMVTASVVAGCQVAHSSIVVNIDGLGENYVLNPVLVSLAAGSYQVDVIGTADGGHYDAYSQWPDDNVSDPDGSPVTIPTTNQGWETGFVVTSPGIGSVTIATLPVTPGPDPGIDWLTDYFFHTLSDAHYGVFDGLVYPDALPALDHGRPSTFVLDADGLVGFGLRDGPGQFGDNRGGLSLRITPISAAGVPEATSIIIWSLLGCVGIVKLWHHRRWPVVR